MKQARQDWREHRYAVAVSGMVKREWPVIAWAISFLLIASTIWQTHALSENTRTSLIEACEHNRSPLNEYFMGELASTRSTDPGLFPDIPPDVFRELLSIKVDRLKAVITVTDPAACAEQYR